MRMQFSAPLPVKVRAGRRLPVPGPLPVAARWDKRGPASTAVERRSMAPGGEFPAWACRMGRGCGQGQPELREGRPPSLQGTSQWVLRSETRWNGLPARGWSVSYPSLRRLVVKRNWRKVGWTTVRTEDTPPGDAAEAAFGRLGIITGPETGRCRGVGHAGPESGRGHRRTGSRLGLLRRDVPVPGHRQFPCHGGAARSLHPVLTGGFPEDAQHRGFIVGPARTGHRQDKPKVERDVPPRQGAFPQGPDCNGLAHMRDEVPR